MSLISTIKKDVKKAMELMSRQDFCKGITYKSFIESEYDPACGEKVDSFSSIFIERAIIISFSDEEVNSGIATRKDRRVLILAEDLGEINPKMSDLLNFDNRDWAISKSDPDPLLITYEFYAVG